MTVSLALLQFAMTEDPSANLDKAVTLIRNAAQGGAQIVCLPELFRSPYFPVVEKTERDYAEPVENGEVVRALSALAAELSIVVVGGSVYEQDGDKRFNTGFVLDADGRFLGKYRKMHIPHDPGFYEQHYFCPGDLGYQVFPTRYGKIAILICFDQWFPEAARAAALAGADIIVYPTAIATVDGLDEREGSWQDAWEMVQRGHAIANNVVVASVNRVGKEGDSNFWGGSFICDAFGKLLARAGNGEEIVQASVDFSHSEYVRDSWGFFRNRRRDSYAPVAG